MDTLRVAFSELGDLGGPDQTGKKLETVPDHNLAKLCKLAGEIIVPLNSCQNGTDRQISANPKNGPPFDSNLRKRLPINGLLNAAAPAARRLLLYWPFLAPPAKTGGDSLD